MKNFLEKYEKERKFLLFDGKLTISKRSSIVEEFLESENKILLISVKTCPGLNFTEADILINIENNFKYNYQQQIISRIKRINNNKEKLIFNLILNDEEEKQKLFFNNIREVIIYKIFYENIQINTKNIKNLILGKEKSDGVNIECIKNKEYISYCYDKNLIVK